MIHLIQIVCLNLFGAEDLFYIANEGLSLSPDQPYLHKSQIKNLSLLTDNEILQIYPNICALST